MAPEVLSDAQLEWHARRVAAAFGVKRFISKTSDESVFFCQGRAGRHTVRWTLTRTYGPLSSITVGKGRDRCKAFCSIGGFWECFPNPQFDNPMAHGLYRLGIEDESIFAQLDPLTAHEKLELRLSLPREFWPTKWLDDQS